MNKVYLIECDHEIKEKAFSSRDKALEYIEKNEDLMRRINLFILDSKNHLEELISDYSSYHRIYNPQTAGEQLINSNYHKLGRFESELKHILSLDTKLSIQYYIEKTWELDIIEVNIDN